MLIEFCTMHMIIFIILYRCFNMKIINLHFLTVLVCIGGLYITFIQNKLVLEELDIIISDRWLVITNIIFHIFPFLYIWSEYKIDKGRWIETGIYLVLYFGLGNRLNEKYKIKNKVERKKILVTILLISLCFIIFIKSNFVQ